MKVEDVLRIVKARSDSNLAMYVDLRNKEYLAAHKECDHIIQLIEDELKKEKKK